MLCKGLPASTPRQGRTCIDTSSPVCLWRSQVATCWEPALEAVVEQVVQGATPFQVSQAASCTSPHSDATAICPSVPGHDAEPPGCKVACEQTGHLSPHSYSNHNPAWGAAITSWQYSVLQVLLVLAGLAAPVSISLVEVSIFCVQPIGSVHGTSMNSPIGRLELSDRSM